MFKKLILAAFVAGSFGGAILTSAMPAAADGIEWTTDDPGPTEEVEFPYGELVVR